MKKYSLSGFEVMEYETLSSTNTLAESLPAGSLEDKQVILAYEQTQGRGQEGNHWESAPGKNILMTVILKPEALLAGRQFAVSMVIALGCLDFIRRYAEKGSVKWPNDVYVGDKKIAGILISHRIAGPYIRHSICGIGVNINQPCFVSDAPNPVSLFQLTGKEWPLEKTLAELLDCIGQRYAAIQDYESLERDFLDSMYRREGIFDWEDENGKFRASIAGIDEYGQLVLRDTEGKERVYAFKEVKYS